MGSKRVVAKPDHIVHLERRYKALEKEIAEAIAHTSPDDPMIIDLKCRMLHVSDELELERRRYKIG